MEEVEKAVKACIEGAGGPGMHVLNLGHGVLQPTPEGNARRCRRGAEVGGSVLLEGKGSRILRRC